jgi:hypothetical protein
VSTARTVRKRAALAIGLLLVAACSGDDDGAEPPATTGTTAPPTPGTLPDNVEPGRGALVLDGELAVLTVTNCTTQPTTDATTGVVTELTAAASDGTRLVDVVRSSFTTNVTTVTDTIRVTDPDGTVLESSRAEVGGRQIDLRLENPVGPLLQAGAGGRIEAAGVFGPPDGVAGDPGNVDGELLLRCP